MHATGSRRHATAALAALLVLAALSAPPAAAGSSGEAADASGDIEPFGTIPCEARPDHGGVRFCQGTNDTRVRTLDGVPLSTSVTLPREGEGDFPLVIQLSGWPGIRTQLPIAAPWARRGYAVLHYSVRGAGNSCGIEESRDDPGCKRGWVHIADSRYEVRDAQHLAGLLVDQGIADPERIGVWGLSYGAGQSLQLATLRDRVREPDGSYRRWRSPGGTPMKVSGAVAIAGWSDLLGALAPNGRPAGESLPGELTPPFGVAKQSLLASLYATGEPDTYYAPAGLDPDADLTGWIAGVSLGEPYRHNATTRALPRLLAERSALHLDMSRRPAPTLVANGFSDDLFGADQSVTWVRAVRRQHPRARIAQVFGDFGHGLAQNKPGEVARLDATLAASEGASTLATTRTFEWFDRYVKGARAAPRTGVEARLKTCPAGAAPGPIYRAKSFGRLSRGAVRFFGGGARSLDSSGGDPVVAAALDPAANAGGGCDVAPARTAKGTATYSLPEAGGRGYTLLGPPRVEARFEISGTRAEDAQVAARLWDLAPDGARVLVTRGVYRPLGPGSDRFTLQAAGWRFEPGHAPLLELLGKDAPYLRPSNAAFEIDVSRLRLRLPTRERHPDAQA